MKQHVGQAAWVYRKVLRHPLLPGFLAARAAGRPEVHVGWGLKPSGLSAMRAAKRTGRPLLLLEDALVRSLRPGMEGACYGLLADSMGIHYAADGNSDLIESIRSGEPRGWMLPSDPDGIPVDELMRRFRETGASKYNWFPGEYRDARVPEETGVLVVDQTRGDASIRHGGMVDGDFERMLRAALDEFDGCPVYVRAHPDHVHRRKHSCLPERLLADARVRLLPPDLSPAQCFSFCHTVLVGGSLMGMEALVHGRRVITFGRPFFAGWGLTDDRAPGADRGARAGLAEVFEAAYVRYCHYFDPDSGEPCGLGGILDHLALQKEMFRRNRGTTVVIGLTPWQRSIVPAYLRSPAGELRHVSGADEAPDSADRFLVWGRWSEVPERIASRTARVEDGFLRSRGLGAAFNFPYSWVVDGRGIYFDAGAPSDLEAIYQSGFSGEDARQARELIDLLREMRLTKYNVGGGNVALDASKTAGRKVILVPGQVEADASIAFGSPELKSNLALLQRVREMEPGAYIVFKAHPDLVAGARHGNVLPPGFAEACDLAVTEGNVLDWLDLCDEVHTMTSTVGFEALIREKPVVTYGVPFYAGWGLTTDRIACARRTRTLTLEELVCGALIRYPRYLNPETGEFTTALKVARLLVSPAAAEDRRPWYLKGVSKAKRLWVEWARRRPHP
ncbi:MAG: capsular polysaccharide biosynthesis protein [Verrucomicrobiae bacterium]|nr:capsular polysaccharide biosynthesis protein [Verrucomicrobiae bacterium]